MKWWQVSAEGEHGPILEDVGVCPTITGVVGRGGRGRRVEWGAASLCLRLAPEPGAPSASVASCLLPYVGEGCFLSPWRGLEWTWTASARQVWRGGIRSPGTSYGLHQKPPGCEASSPLEFPVWILPSYDHQTWAQGWEQEGKQFTRSMEPDILFSF